MKLTIGEIIKATDGQRIRGSLGSVVNGVSTDSRTLRRGQLFVALRGDRHDGHDHLEQVRRKGAAAVLVQKKVRCGIPNVVLVKDTLRALGDVAQEWRRRFPVQVVGITGSNGKTTAKDMAAAVLSQSHRVLRTEGNFNNLIGLPLTVFRLRGDEDFAVLEMGMNHPGEIDRLAEIASPNAGLITNVGRAHLEGVGGLSGVAKAKGELLDHIGVGGFAVLNRDNPFFNMLSKRAKAAGVNVVSFGLRKGADYRAEDVRMDGLKGLRFFLKTGGKKVPFFLPVLGRHNVLNALAAVAIGDRFGVPFSKMRSALGRFHTGSKRMETVSLPRGVTVINDCYNANPDSTAASLDFLKEASASRRSVAVIGDMLELGKNAREAHRETGRKAVDANVRVLVAVGPHARDVVRGAVERGLPKGMAFSCGGSDAALSLVRSVLRRGDLVLIKGSRGMKMEKITEGLKGEVRK